MAQDKLELLKKFTRLANNNPNENEANVAARRVCKLLEEMNWVLPQITNNSGFRARNPFSGSSPTGRNPNDDWFAEEMRRAAKEAENFINQQQKAKQEAEKKAKQAKENAEYVRKEREHAENLKREREKRRPFDPSPRYEPDYEDAFWGRTYNYRGQEANKDDVWVETYSNTFINSRTGQEISAVEYHAKWSPGAQKRSSEPKEIPCSVCGAVHKTMFRGIPALFVCFACQRKA